MKNKIKIKGLKETEHKIRLKFKTSDSSHETKIIL